MLEVMDEMREMADEPPQLTYEGLVVDFCLTQCL